MFIKDIISRQSGEQCSNHYFVYFKKLPNLYLRPKGNLIYKGVHMFIYHTPTLPLTTVFHNFLQKLSTFSLRQRPDPEKVCNQPTSNKSFWQYRRHSEIYGKEISTKTNTLFEETSCVAMTYRFGPRVRCK